MRNSVVYLVAMFIVFSFASCGKDGGVGPEGQQGIVGTKGDRGDKGDTGDVGPRGDQGETGPRGEEGPRGPKGDPGKDGTANVMSSDWITFDWGRFDVGSFAYADKTMSQDASNILDNGGVLLVYGRNKPNSGHYTQYAIPYTRYGYDMVISYELSSSSTLWIHVHKLNQSGNFNGVQKDFVYQFRYVVIPKGVSISKANPNPTIDDWKKLSFDQTKQILNLRD